MKVYTSYFYQVRHFKPNMLPFSTAMSDPRWFHGGGGKDFVFQDARGVVNGLRLDVLAPRGECIGKCVGAKDCSLMPDTCDFLRAYARQLQRIDFEAFIEGLEDIALEVKKVVGFEGEPEIALVVYEAPGNLCSERVPLQHWFAENGYSIEEFVPEPR